MLYQIQVFGKYLETTPENSITGFVHDGWTTVQTCEAHEVAQYLVDRHQSSSSKYTGPVRIVEVS